MSFTAKDVMSLREKTGVGMMDCKKALTATDGDMDKAIDFLREKGLATAGKKASRIASEGIVSALIKDNIGVLIEVNCESDFVARGDGFKNFVDGVAKYVLENNVKTIEEVKEANESDRVTAVSKIGENIQIRRFEKFTSTDGTIDSYIHMGGKIGVLVEASKGADSQILHDVALQIAAAKPLYISSDQVPQAMIDHEKEISNAQAMNTDKPKPQAIIEKMAEGRVKKYFKEICLLEQEFVKDSNMTIAKYLKTNGDIQIFRFARFEMGEGLEKKQDDFAKEIMEQVAKVK